MQYAYSGWAYLRETVMKRGRTVPLKGGGEYDALTSWRHDICVFGNYTGLAKWWKRRFNKRVRREASMMCRNVNTSG